MPTKKEISAETSPIASNKMNVWAKLLSVRKEFYKEGAKKTGKNLHAEFMYFELKDIVPVAAPIFAKYGLLLIPTFIEGNAVAKVVNIENPEEYIHFTIPLQFISEPAKFRMNEVQGVGAVVTYYRRYLYMIVLDLIEEDDIDKVSGTINKSPVSPPQSKKPATSEERKKIKKELTNPEDEADDLQKDALKAALKTLMDLDPSQEEFIQQIIIKTDKFTNIKRAACEELILALKKMIQSYNV